MNKFRNLSVCSYCYFLKRTDILILILTQGHYVFVAGRIFPLSGSKRIQSPALDVQFRGARLEGHAKKPMTALTKVP